MNEIWYVYMLECSDNSIYTGITNDLDRRLKQHNDGKAAKYTRVRRPVKILVSFNFDTRGLAMKEEYRIKQLRRKDKLILINKQNKNENKN